MFKHVKYGGSFNIDNNAQIIHYNYIQDKNDTLKIKNYSLPVKTKCIKYIYLNMRTHTNVNNSDSCLCSIIFKFLSKTRT